MNDQEQLLTELLEAIQNEIWNRVKLQEEKLIAIRVILNRQV